MSYEYCIGKIPIPLPDGKFLTDDDGEVVYNQVPCKILHWGRKPVFNVLADKFLYEDVIYAVNTETMEIVELDPLKTTMADYMEEDDGDINSNYP